MAKRSNGAGSIYRRGDGRWAATLTYVDAQGQSRRQTFYGKTQTEARTKMRDAKARVERGAAPKDAKLLLRDYAREWITTTLAASDRKETTKQTYGTLARTWIIGGDIGSKPLDKLRPTDVERFTLGMKEAGKADATVRQTYTVLRAVLDTAVRDRLLASNPAAAVRRPGVARKEARSLPVEDVKALLAASEASGSRYATLLHFLAATGLRRGEALAARWEDVDLEEGVLRVTGTLSRVGGALVVTEPKSERSRRYVALGSSVVERLRAHKARQEEERRLAGAAWHDLGLVFSTEAGGYVDPRNALRALSVAAGAAGLEGVGLHTLRHSAASAMLAAGAPLVTVSEVLGHSSVAITGDVYGHVTTKGARDALTGLSDALG